MNSTHFAILMYHSLDDSGSVVSIHPRVFENQMSAVDDAGFRGISVREAVQHRIAHGCWPEHSLAITFDDGFANNHDHAMPVLARYGFTATIYLVTRHMGGTNNWAPPPAALGLRPMVTWEQARELASAGWELGAHTRTHPNLSNKMDQSMCIAEMEGSREDIESATGQRVTSFAYPYGEVSPAVVKCATAFESACSTLLRSATAADPLHLLPRIDAYYLGAMNRISLLLEGRLKSYLTMRRALRRMRRWIVG